MATLYLTDDGDAVERGQLRAIDQEGSNNDSGESPSNEVMELGTAMSATEILEFTITHVYMLEPISLSSELESALASGTAYYHVLSSASHNGCQFFLLKNSAGYFLLGGEWTGFEYIGLEEADISPPDINGLEDDNADGLDFNML